MKLSLIIPARNEGQGIAKTVSAFDDELARASIDHEVLVVNDHSEDDTEEVLKELTAEKTNVKYVNNHRAAGFARAVKTGFDNYTGGAAAIVMGDLSDDPADLVRFFHKLEEGYDCVFGSRFINGGAVIDYPRFKLFLNRLGNALISLLFGVRYNDVTNAFKLYRRGTLNGLAPFISEHFNLTVELPLKAIVRGYSYAVLPNKWTNRAAGKSKFKIKEMGSRYFFIILYCLIEKWLSRGDYLKKT